MDVYKIGVSLSLINGVSGVLSVIQAGMNKLNRSVVEANANLGRLKMAAAGLGAIAIGASIFKGLDDLTKHGDKYIHQLELMKIAGMDIIEQNQAIAAARQTSSSVMTTTPTENLEAIRELRMALASAEVRADGKMGADALKAATGEAIAHLQTIQKVTGIIGSELSKNGKVNNAKDQAYELTKATEILGLSQDPKKFDAVLEGWTQAIIASGGKLNGRDFFSTVKYLRGAGMGMSIDFLTNILPSLMQEMKTGSGSGQGGGAGNPLASLFAETVGGQMSKKSIDAMRQIHMLNESKIKKTKFGETALPGAIIGSDVESINPFQFIKEYIEPHLKKYTNLLDKGADGQFMHPGELRGLIFQLFPNRTAQQIASMMLFQGQRILGDKALKESAFPINPAYEELVRHDPVLARFALQEQFERVTTDLGAAISPTVTEGIYRMAKALSYIAEVIERHPVATKYAMLTAAAIAGFLVVLGSIGVVAAAISAIAGGPAIAAFGVLIIGIGAAIAYAAEKFHLLEGLSLPGLPSGLSDMSSGVSSRLNSLMSTGPALLGGMMQGLSGKITSYFREHMPDWSAALDRAFLGVVGLFTRGLAGFVGWMKSHQGSWQQAVIHGFAALGEIIARGIEAIWPMLLRGATRFRDVMAVYLPIWNQQLGEGLKAFSDSVAQFGKELGPILLRGANELGPILRHYEYLFFLSAWQGAKNLWQMLLDGVEAGARDRQSEVGKVIAKANQAFVEDARKFAEGLRDFVQAIVDAIKAIPGRLLSSITGMHLAPAPRPTGAGPQLPGSLPPGTSAGDAMRALLFGEGPSKPVGPGAPPVANDNRGTPGNPLIVHVENQPTGNDIARGVQGSIVRKANRPPTGITGSDLSMDPLSAFYQAAP